MKVCNNCIHFTGQTQINPLATFSGQCRYVKVYGQYQWVQSNFSCEFFSAIPSCLPTGPMIKTYKYSNKV